MFKIEGPFLMESNWTFVQIKMKPGAAELGAQGAQLRTHFFTIWQLIPAFSRKKNFENPSKIDQVRGKNVNCAPIFQQLPPPLVPTYDPRQYFRSAHMQSNDLFPTRKQCKLPS